MTAAVRVLQRAIEDAVQQLEPQLLPLFNGSKRPGRDTPARPTQRTQLALKMLVALTRFFPDAHRVREAGRQLELIWPPLVLEPRGAVAGKLLQHYFRLRQDLLDAPESALRNAMRELARVTLEAAQTEGPDARVADCERQLQALAQFLPELAFDAMAMEGAAPLARLVAWQQALDPALGGYLESGSVSPLLLPDMLTVADRCMALCRASDWSLDWFCTSGLASGLWQLRGIARFSGNDVLAALFAELDDTCLDMHLCGSRPQPGILQQWLVRLFCAVHEDASAPPLPRSTAALPDLPFRALYDEELANYRRQLQAELQAHARVAQGECAKEEAEGATLFVSAALITLLYKLTWVFAAAEQPDWARLCHCAYRVALQHWRIRLPLSAGIRTLLLDMAHNPGSDLPPELLRQWRARLLREWPRWTDDAQRPIALQPESGEVIALDAVPDLLSASFTTLVQAGRLAAAPSAETCASHFQVLLRDLAPELLHELSLLEKGAAAMKVWPLEQLCTALIAVYELQLRDEREPPTSLLQDAHRQLVRMLDQAAAWRELQVDRTLMQALEAWVSEASAARNTCREPRGEMARATEGDHADAEQLRTQLLAYLGTLAAVLERPVRLQLDAEQLQLSPQGMNRVLDCLRPLIKYMLLDQSIDTRTRHAMHKPRISTLYVALRMQKETLLLTAGEDSHEEVLTQAELQRLQRRLPKEAGTLACESRAGRGRAFTFTLGCNAAG